MKKTIDRIKGFFRKDHQPVPELKWVDSSNNQFGVSLLDLRNSVFKTTAWTTRKDIAESFLRMRKMDGKEHLNKLPEDCVEFVSNLSFAYSGAHDEGPVFKARVMEDKWDMYVFGDRLYVARSWTGTLCFVAICEFKPDRVEIHRIFTEKKIVSADLQYAGRVVDFLIKSHMSNMVVPHPLPARLKHESIEEIMTHSYEMFGRRGLFGSFDETIGILGQQAAAPDGQKASRE
jgi:hypothetical protein